MSTLPKALTFIEFSQLSEEKKRDYLDVLQRYQQTAHREHLLTAHSHMTQAQLEQHLQTIRHYYQVLCRMEGHPIL